MIDRRFSADGGIHLRKHRSGNVVKINTAHKAGGGKARKIPHNAAANRNYCVGAGEAVFKHHRAKVGEGGKAFAVLALGNGYNHGRLAGSGNGFGVFGGNALVGDHQNASVKL